MAKTEMLSWRISPELKRLLAESARAERTSMANLLERIVTDWIRRHHDEDEEKRQRGLRKSASACLGVLEGGDPERSRRARERLREKLRGRRRNRSS